MRAPAPAKTGLSITRRWSIASALLSLTAGPTWAQASFPAKPVRFIVPFPPGGPVDTTARIVAQKLSEMWGQQVVIDNRAGAGGMVGAEAAAKSAADGYTVFVCSIHHAVWPGMKPKLSYDIEKDFVPLTFGARFPIILVANPAVPATTLTELIALAKKNPGRLSFGSSGNGGGTHLAGELFNLQAGTELQHIPYKGSAPAMTDLLGGQVSLMFSDAPTALGHIKSGKVRALGIANAQRSDLVPGVPSMAESGLPGYEAYSWAGFVAPAGVPREMAAKLSQDIAKALAQPDVRQRLMDVGAEAAPTTAEQFGKLLHTEIAKWTRVVKAANIQPD